MADLSDAALDAALLSNGNWNPKPLRRDDRPDDYPVGRLPGIIGDAVREVADYVQAPVALVAGSALSVVSAAIQTQFTVCRDEHMRGPASLYFLTVAESGERKSTVDKQFMKPIRDWESRQRREAEHLEAEYQRAREAWDRQQGDKGDPPERPGPTPKMLRIDDTPEALVRHLTGYPIAAVISAEAGVVFGGHAMNPDNVQRNLAQANSLWDGGPIIEGRIGRGEVNIENAHVTMGLMVQPDVLQKFVAKTNGLARGIGYLARFLFCQPETTQGTRFYRKAGPMPGLDAFHQRVTLLLRTPAAKDELGRLITQPISFDDTAQDVWEAFHNEVEELIGGDREYSAIRGEASKAAENAARLACCLHVFTKMNGFLIDAWTMDQACALMRWYLDEAVRFGRSAEATEEMRNAELLEVWLVDKWKEARRDRREWDMKVNTIRQYAPNAVRGKRISDALELLQDHGRIRVLPLSGSKSKLVTIAPQVIAEYS